MIALDDPATEPQAPSAVILNAVIGPRISSADSSAAPSALHPSPHPWPLTPIAARLKILRRTRHLIAAQTDDFIAAISADLTRTASDTLTSELLPLLDAIRFLERSAKKILATHKPGRKGRPAWMAGTQTEIRRAAWGHVLIIAPANFPLFLAGVQTLQALAAGNRVTWKPGRGGAAVAHLVARALERAGLPANTLRVTDDSIATGQAALAGETSLAGATAVAGETTFGAPDLVLFTGSSENGSRILAQLAPTATPAIMELSGCDAVVVLAAAQLDEAVRALRFGLRLNGGNVCMRPQRVIAPRAMLAELQAALPDAALTYIEATDEQQILTAIAGSDYALTISIFSGAADQALANALAAKAKAGVILHNDLIAPTADPRAPFGGRGRSGFGVTRGAEGLLAMTTPKVIYTRSPSKPARHFAPVTAAHPAFFAAWIRLMHSGSLSARWQGFRDLMQHGRAVRAAESAASKTHSAEKADQA